MREILNIPLNPDTLFTIHEHTGISQAELEVRMSQANDNNEIAVYHIEKSVHVQMFPKPKEQNHG